MIRREWVGSICGVVTDAEDDDPASGDREYGTGDWEPCTECDDDECIAIMHEVETDGSA